MIRVAAAAGLVLAVAACATADGTLHVDDAWARPTVSGPTAAYLSIRNGTPEPDRLIGARSPCCATIELHRTEITGDRMRMVPARDGLVVEPGKTVTLTPGEHHLMLFEPREPLRVGARLEAVLEFETYGELAIEIEIRR